MYREPLLGINGKGNVAIHDPTEQNVDSTMGNMNIRNYLSSFRRKSLTPDSTDSMALLIESVEAWRADLKSNGAYTYRAISSRIKVRASLNNSEFSGCSVCQKHSGGLFAAIGMLYQ